MLACVRGQNEWKTDERSLSYDPSSASFIFILLLDPYLVREFSLSPLVIHFAVLSQFCLAVFHFNLLL